MSFARYRSLPEPFFARNRFSNATIDRRYYLESKITTQYRARGSRGVASLLDLFESLVAVQTKLLLLVTRFQNAFDRTRSLETSRPARLKRTARRAQRHTRVTAYRPCTAVTAVARRVPRFRSAGPSPRKRARPDANAVESARPLPRYTRARSRPREPDVTRPTAGREKRRYARSPDR